MIAVLTTISENAADSMQSVKEAYCNLYGYDFFITPRNYYKGRHLAWQKIGLMLEKLPYYDWVVHLAPDIGFANFSCGIERVINEQSKKHDIIVSRDTANSVDTDVIFCRNSFKAARFLEKWGSEESYVKWPGGMKHDRWAFYQMAMGEYSNLVSMVSPIRVINAYAKANADYFRRQYHTGDFIENCTMCTEEEKRMRAERIMLDNRAYITKGKDCVRYALRDEYCREVSRIARQDMIFNKRKNLTTPKPVEEVTAPAKKEDATMAETSVASEIAQSIEDDGVGNYIDNLDDDVRKVEIKNKNEMITIYRNAPRRRSFQSQPIADKSAKPGFSETVTEKTQTKGWGFAYPTR